MKQHPEPMRYLWLKRLEELLDVADDVLYAWNNYPPKTSEALEAALADLEEMTEEYRKMIDGP